MTQQVRAKKAHERSNEDLVQATLELYSRSLLSKEVHDAALEHRAELRRRLAEHSPVEVPPAPYEHVCDTPNYTDGPCYACARDKVLEWVFERYENCLRIAAQKTGDDKRGWLEDADHFLFVLQLLKDRVPHAAAEPKLPVPIQPGDLSREGPFARGDAVIGRTADEPHHPLVCFVCGKQQLITFNFCLDHKDEYERFKKLAAGSVEAAAPTPTPDSKV